MAQKLYLNLDELIDEQPERFVIFRKKEYAVAGLTGELLIRYMKTESKRNKALESGDRGAQFEEGVNMALLCVPGLTEKKEELLGLKLPVLNKLVDYLSNEWKQQVDESEQPENVVGDGSTAVGE